MGLHASDLNSYASVKFLLFRGLKIFTMEVDDENSEKSSTLSTRRKKITLKVPLTSNNIPLEKLEKCREVLFILIRYVT